MPRMLSIFSVILTLSAISGCSQLEKVFKSEDSGSQIGVPALEDESKQTTIWDALNRDLSQTPVKVNRYIWQAALEVLDFMPIETIDPFSGNPTIFELNSDALVVARGEYEYHEHCQFCHGAGVIGGGVLPDLRMLDAQGHASFLGSVLGGIHGSGMASFKDVLNVEQAQQIHEYIKHQTVLTGLAIAAEQ